MTINLTALQKQRRDTAANWTGANPTLLAGEIGIESDTLRWKAGDGSTAWTSLAYIPGLAYGTARQLLQTNSGATSAEWTSNVDIPGTLDVTGTSTLDGMVLVGLTSSIGGGKLQVSTDTATAIQSFTFSSAADTNTSTLQLVRARGTKASPSVLLNNDYIGEIRFLGYGTTYNQGAIIRAVVDGEPATSGDTSDMPTKLVFLTSPNGSATPDTRMTIDSAGLVTIPGDLTVNGTTTTINSTTLVVQDKNIEMGVVATPTDVTADGGGITLKGTTDKTINWIDSTDAWTFSEHVNIASAKEYRIAGTKVLDATSLGSAVVGSSLTSVGTISSGTWNGTAIADTYLATISTALKVSNSATTATSANTASAIVARDASGNFTAGTITATLTGNASTVTTNANLTGDVTSVGNATSIAAGVIVDADINASAAIVDTKLATISTAGKVSNSATTAASANTASAIVARDASGNFTAGTITAALTGAASSNVLKAGDTMTGALVVPLASASTPSLTFTGDLDTGVFSPGANQVAISTNGTSRLSIDASGNLAVDTNTLYVDAVNNRVAIGTTTPEYNLQIAGTNATVAISASNASASSVGTLLYRNVDGNSNYRSIASIEGETIGNGGYGALAFHTAFNNSLFERARIDDSGRLLVGTSTSASAGGGTNIQQNVNSTNDRLLGLHFGGASATGPYITLSKSRNTGYGSYTIVNNGDVLGGLIFAGDDGTDYATSGAYIEAYVDGTPGANDLPTRLVFSTTADGSATPTERMRIKEGGTVVFKREGFSGNPGYDTTGVSINDTTSGSINVARSGSAPLFINRLTNDGDLILFGQDITSEGSISVSGTTVSYNGAHLSRWSQLPSGAERIEILRGSVLSNIDEMCEWGEEDNEQLNRMKVSDVEGDSNVSGVFQCWDDDDDTYTDDFYCAMTGDFIIRIAEGTPVHRGQLLMSAGDGTAKPQDDDIIRSKTIAKVTSNHVTCTYDDGSYCVPCVLMAC